MCRRTRLMFAAMIFCFGAGSLAAQQPGGQKAAEKAAEKPKEEKKPAPEEKSVQTKHAVRIGEQEIKNPGTEETMLLKREDGTQRASVFFVAYTRDDVVNASRRQ